MPVLRRAEVRVNAQEFVLFGLRRTELPVVAHAKGMTAQEVSDRLADLLRRSNPNVAISVTIGDEIRCGDEVTARRSPILVCPDGCVPLIAGRPTWTIP